ncbi:MAG: alpha-ketoglutarate-dependent dioxygenase AlkB [Lentisphaeria bacterium]|nr:alpha-ketoglutarate-dependent dioxygenase AlkB [Lentisphaeria bacterium]
MELGFNEHFERPNADIYYYPNFLNIEQADFIFNHCVDELEWSQRYIKMFGKELPNPRLESWYGDPGAHYIYSGLKFDALPWTKALKKLKTSIEEKANHRFNSVLCNLYRSGNDSMGWHADDEPELGKNPVIASLTLGQERSFHLKHNNLKEQQLKLNLSHGSLLIMAGETQHFWKHQIPKSKRKLLPRVNLTFRKVQTKNA